MRLSDLQHKNIVNINDGKNIGSIIDANISEEGKVESLVIETNKSIFSFNREEAAEISWSNISKIGEDVILVKFNY